MSELWNEILDQHWIYLESEESIVKLENRKKIEDSLKKYLGIIEHKRKFSLEETAKVLKKSIAGLKDFSAQKAITAFESISQYANNLFTKPWRKEFRILKMYSGFYQHEIHSNLIDAEILFEAMGYRRLSEDTLVLDGPICPDQVSNVSRDAMTAYVELQIIKHIYAALNAIGVNFSCLDIYRYREKFTGDTSDVVKAIVYSIEDKRLRSKQKAMLGDNYGYSDVQPNYFETNTQFCLAQCQHNLFQQTPIMFRHGPIARPNEICCVPEHQQQPTKMPLVYNSMHYPNRYLHHLHHNHLGISSDSGGAVLPQILHSKSLEHYSEPVNHHNNVLPHRHSLDHPQYRLSQQQQQQQQKLYCTNINQTNQNLYESLYDCIDDNSLGGGSSTISYTPIVKNTGVVAAITGDGSGVPIHCNLNSNSSCTHSYNVSGNRFPLPLNISNQLSADDNLQSINCNDHQEQTYVPTAEKFLHFSDSNLPHNFVKNTNAVSYNQSGNVYTIQTPSSVEEPIQRQHSCQSEYLNNEDPTVLPPTTSQEKLDHYNIRGIQERTFPPAVTIYQQHCGTDKPTPYDTYIYAKPTPRENRKQNVSSLPNKSYNCRERGDATDVSYESANEDISKQSCDNEPNRYSSPTQFQKNQDGIGSIESWSNAFQNIEQNSHYKDLGERNDLLVQSLDLDSLSINNGISSQSQSSINEKRYSADGNKSSAQLEQKQIQYLESKYQSITSENDKVESKNKAVKKENSANIQKQKPSTGKKIKSPKQTNSNLNKTQPKTRDNKIISKTVNNNNNDLLTNCNNGNIQNNKRFSSVVNTTQKSASTVSTNTLPASSEIIVTGENEWSCKACTFINTIDKRVCEVCGHSKNFELEPSTSSTAAGGATVSPNTTTCA